MGLHVVCRHMTAKLLPPPPEALEEPFERTLESRIGEPVGRQPAAQHDRFRDLGK